MIDHSYYEELTALLAGGHLSAQEYRELREHMVTCDSCRATLREFQDLVEIHMSLSGENSLPLLNRILSRPSAGARERFLARAEADGVRLSRQIVKPISRESRPLAFHLAAAAIPALAILVLAFLGVSAWKSSSQSKIQAKRQVDQLRTENAALTAHLTGLEQQTERQQREIQKLRETASNAAVMQAGYRDKSRVTLGQSTSQDARLVDELQDRDQDLSAAKDELARINQIRAANQADLALQQIRIKELSDQLRIANATLDTERQLAAAGRDIRELLVARQLHVVDVRDTDAEGRPTAAFGRVFMTEGKSLIFYAFDLSGSGAADAKTRFEVWGEEAGKKNLVRSLGMLYADDTSQRRWALKVSNPELLSEINSVFVTVAVPGRSDKPTGPRLLYAYLGDANHP